MEDHCSLITGVLQHRMDLREDHCIEDQKRERERERERASSYCYGPVGPGKTTHTSSWRRQGWWRWPPQWFPPPAEYRNRAPDGIASEQRLAAAIKLFRVSLSGFLDLWEFIGQELGQTELHRGPTSQGGAPYPPGRAPLPCGALVALLVLPKLLGSLIVQKNRQKVSSCLDFCRYGFSAKPKTCRKQELALGTKLIG